MPETYDARLVRRLRVRSKFPPALQQVSIRYVDEIDALDTRQHELLIEVMANGKSVRQTLPKLKKLGEDATIELLLKEDNLPWTARRLEGAVTSQDGQAFDREDVEALTDILDECFPGMPPASAAALAESPVMAETLQIVKDLRFAAESQNFNSDFVVVSLYAVIKYVKKNIEDKIRSNPAFLQTVRSSGLIWEGEK